jgi:hypothetical protein
LLSVWCVFLTRFLSARLWLGFDSFFLFLAVGT